MSHWRNTFKPARLLMMDAKAGIPLLATLLYFRPITVAISAATLVIFWYMERIGMSFSSAMRALRSWASGRHRPTKLNKIRFKVDYDRRPL